MFIIKTIIGTNSTSKTLTLEGVSRDGIIDLVCMTNDYNKRIYSCIVANSTPL